VQGNHVHLLVEANDEKALTKGMNGLGTRIARRLHLANADGAARARAYRLANARKHCGQREPDPYTSVVAVIAPDTFLMRRLC
jgi:REP element-mobilizing transposase RayT